MSRIEHVGQVHLADGRRLELTDYYSAAPGISNLRCVDPYGQQIWVAELGNSQDGHYVSMEIDAGRIFANSWDCYRIELDPESGRIVSRIFTK